MKITCWGCRGSLPTPGPTTVKYGGNTTCFQVDGADGTLVVIDAGSGIRFLGNHLVKKDPRRTLSLLFTHYHWDHLMGFPFFLPAFLKKYTINIMGYEYRGHPLKEVISHQLEAPHFPVEFNTLKSKMTFKSQYAEKFRLGSLEIETIHLNHPNGGYGFKFRENNRQFVFLTDNEISFDHGVNETRETYREFCCGADLLIHDAQYFTKEYNKTTQGWGHSTYNDAFLLGLTAGVKRLGFCHHDQVRTDHDLDIISKNYGRKNPRVKCFAVKENDIYRL